MLALRESNILKATFILFSLLLITNTVSAQDTTSADGLYAIARQKAFEEKNYEAALVYARKALAITPDYTDLLLFTGRVYAWNKQPDSARYYFEIVTQKNPAPEDAYVAYADLEFWEGNNDAALAIAEQGLTANRSSTALQLRKAKVLNSQRQYQQAILVLDTLLTLNKGNTEARALAAQIKDNISKNKIGVKYDYITFDKQFNQPWHFLSVDYTRQAKAGSFTARVNYANRFGTGGYQYEIESYPKFSKTFYGFINAGYSDNAVVFPKWRLGASLFANLPNAFELEGGIRYLYFTSDVFIYTLYVGKYYKSFLFGARTYLTPNASSTAQSYSALVRYYYGGVDDYVGLNLNAGISPDDRRTNIQLNNNYNLKSYSAELTARYSIRKLNVILFNASLLNQEYLPKTVGNQYQVGVGYIRRF